MTDAATWSTANTLRTRLARAVAPRVLDSRTAKHVDRTGEWNSYTTLKAVEHIITRAGRALRGRDSRIILQADENLSAGHLKLRARLKDGSGAAHTGYVGKATVTVGYEGGVMLAVERGAIGYSRREGLRPSHVWCFGVHDGRLLRHDTDSANDVPYTTDDLARKGSALFVVRGR